MRFASLSSPLHPGFRIHEPPRESGHHFLDHGKGQLGGAVFAAAAGGFEGVAEFHQVLDLGDDLLWRMLHFSP